MRESKGGREKLMVWGKELQRCIEAMCPEAEPGSKPHPEHTSDLHSGFRKAFSG